MSSNEDDYQDGEGSQQGRKKRRIQRACDICRRKKIRCDGVQMPGNRCSNCISYSLKCTYVEAAKKRGPPKGYVEALESRLEKMDKLLRKLCPDEGVLKELEASLNSDKWSSEKVSGLLDTENPAKRMIKTSPTEIMTKAIRESGGPLVVPDDDDIAHLKLSDHMKNLHIESSDNRFFGKSSGAMLIQAAIDLKHEYTGHQDLSIEGILGARRPEFWSIRPWEKLSSRVEVPLFTFPEDDLLYSLLDLYFNHFNLTLPLLHRPTFERSIAEGLHLTDSRFGSVVLLVCALGSRFSHDPRVLLDGISTYHSAGWKWFEQVQKVKRTFVIPPNLYDLQFHSLAVQYLLGCSAPQQCWVMIGIGIRVAQDVGAHRRKYKSENITVEDELWKRAFWVLICIDRIVSSSFGRPSAIQDEDFDIDLPVDCDDEYWDHPDPAQRFKQPPNKPSSATAFIIYIKILQILGLSLRTIYSINKSKVLLGFVGKEWEQQIVAELDSALNKWVDSVPDYLRWDPNREDLKFFDQSAWLYSTYYYIQILVHRPFIPFVGKPSPLAFPSLAICTNAARSCSHIVDFHARRSTTSLQFQIPVFTSGIVLLLNIWSGKRNGLSTDPVKEMAEVHKCMAILKLNETRSNSAGRLWDILYELAFAGDLPLPKSSPPNSNKRERDADSPASSTTSDTVSSSSLPQDMTRNIAGSRRVRESMQQSSPAELARQFHPQGFYTLPVYSEELGRLPVHGQVAFSPQGKPPNHSPFSHWNHAPVSDINVTSRPPPTGPPQDHSSDNTSGGSSIPMDRLMFDSTGLNYNTFVQELFTSSSLGTTSSNHGINSRGADPHQGGGEGFLDLANAQTMIDSDAIAMWSNAPSGFDLDDWGAYLSNVSELTHGQPLH
ncbi:hypothetical protein L208DRAFT_1406132 [Tricholoma matsutake]|nr:hypothetical protein L208DRAFT_1406132 [Tricholoma matsutake 945]